MANIEEKVTDLVREKIEKLGYNLYDVEYTKELLRKEKHLEGAIGEEIEIKLFKTIEKQKTLSRYT